MGHLLLKKGHKLCKVKCKGFYFFGMGGGVSWPILEAKFYGQYAFMLNSKVSKNSLSQSFCDAFIYAMVYGNDKYSIIMQSLTVNVRVMGYKSFL